MFQGKYDYDMCFYIYIYTGLMTINYDHELSNAI